MKRIFILLAGVILLLSVFSSCSDDSSEIQSGALKQIVMTASDFEVDAGSRTNFQITSEGAEFSWAANDTVGIFPNEGAQAYFPMISGAGTKTAKFDGGGWALKNASTYSAYYPFIGDIYLNRNAIPVNYTGQVQTGDASTAHLGIYDYMSAIPDAPKNGNVNFAFKHLGALVQLKLTILEPSTIHSVSLVTENESFAIKGKVDIMSSNPSITPVSTSKNLSLQVKDIVTTEANQVVTLYLMIPPTDLSSQTLKAVVSTSLGNKEATLEHKNFQAGKAYALSGLVNETINEGDYDAVINENAKIIDDKFVSYVTNTIGFSTIVMDIKTPSEFLPTVGDVILCGVEDEKFPYGFAGKVSQVKKDATGYIIETEQPELGEIFEFIKLKGKGSLEFIPQTESRASDVIFSIKEKGLEFTAKPYKDNGTFKGTSVDMTLDLKKRIEYGSEEEYKSGEIEIGSQIHLGGDLGFRYEFELSENVVGQADCFNFNIDILKRLKFDMTLGLEGEANFRTKLAELPLSPIKVKLGNCIKNTKKDSRYVSAVTKLVFILLQPKLSLNYRTNAAGKINLQFGTSCSEITHFTVQNKQCNFTTSNGDDIGASSFAKANLEGSMKTGLELAFEMNPMWRNSKDEKLVDVNFYAGPQITGTIEAGYGAENNICFEIVPLDMNLSGKVTFYPLMIKDKKPQFSLSASQNWRFGEHKRWLFPHYEEFKADFVENEENILSSALLKDSTILPIKVGFSLYDKEENYIKKSKEFQEYRLPPSDGLSLQDEFSDIDTTQTYYVKPTIELLGKTIEYDQKILVGEKDELREALIKLYLSTNGDNWTHNDNWCSDKPVEEWYGVKKWEYNKKYTLDLSGNNLVGIIEQTFPENIMGLYVSDNQLTSIDVSGCASLEGLECWNNLLISLNISGCTSLDYLECSNNQLSTLDVSECVALNSLGCSNNQLSTLDVSECVALNYLGCTDNQLSTLDVSKCIVLKNLWCSNNQLTSLNISGCIALEYIECFNNKLTSLNLSKFTDLKTLNCWNNQLVSLDVSECEGLEHLSGSNNMLTSLNVSGCIALEYLYCSNSLLTSLDVSGCIALDDLRCNNNKLISLNVSGCVALSYLDCTDNQLLSLNVSGCTSLEHLRCKNNKILSVIPDWFPESPAFFTFIYDIRYEYTREYKNGKWVVEYKDNGVGWWYPGEPEKGHHRRN